MKRWMSLAVCLCVAAVCSAQVSFFAKAGVNLSSFGGWKNAEADVAGSRVGYQVGGGLDWFLLDRLSFRPSLWFVAKGAELDFSSGMSVSEARFSPTYIELPLQAAYRFPLGNKVALSAAAGPYLALGLGGSWETEVGYGDETYEYSEGFFGSGEEVEARAAISDKRFDAGLKLGIDCELFSHYLVGFEASWGLTELAEYGSDEKGWSSLKNRTYYFSVGYRF